MSLIKLNFLVLENFINAHKELTEEQIQEILSLDTNHNTQPIITDPETGVTSKSFTDREEHVLDEEEMRQFFSSKGIDYQKISQAQNGLWSDWRTKLALYIAQNLDGAELQSVINFKKSPFPVGVNLLKPGDPIPEGFSTIAEYNFSLYLDYFKQSLESSSDINGIVDALSVGPISATRVLRVNRVSETQYQFVEDMVSFDVRPDEVFWSLVDPKGETPDLKLRFMEGLRNAQLNTFNLNQYHLCRNDFLQITQSGDDFIYGTDPSVVAREYVCEKYVFQFGEVKTFFQDFSARIRQPIDFNKTEGHQQINPDWTVAETSRRNFEDILKKYKTNIKENSFSDAIKEAFIKDLKTVFPSMAQSQIVIETVDRDCFLKVDGQNQVEVYDLMRQNGYWIDGSPKEGVVMRLLESVVVAPSNSRPPNMYDPETNSRIQKHYLDCEPVDDEESAILSEWLAKNGPKILTGELPQSYLIPFFIRQGGLKSLSKNAPWITPLMDSLYLRDNELNEAVIRFYKDYECIGSFVPADRFYGEQLLNEPLLRAIQGCSHPKACLTVLLLLATHEETVGQGQLRSQLPYLFSHIEFFREGEGSYKQVGGHFAEITVGGKDVSPGNAWVYWRDEDIAKIAGKLAIIPEAEITNSLQDITSNDSEFVDYLFDHTIQGHVILAKPSHYHDKIDVKKSEAFIDSSLLIKKCRLQTTRDLIRNIDPLLAGLTTQDLKYTSLSGAEREDLKRALKHVPIIPTGRFDPLEILPLPVIVQGIREDLVNDYQMAWGRVFREDPQAAMDLFVEMVQNNIDQTNPDPAKINKLKTAYDHILALSDSRAEELSTTYQHYFMDGEARWFRANADALTLLKSDFDKVTQEPLSDTWTDFMFFYTMLPQVVTQRGVLTHDEICNLWEWGGADVGKDFLYLLYGDGQRQDLDYSNAVDFYIRISEAHGTLSPAPLVSAMNILHEKGQLSQDLLQNIMTATDKFLSLKYVNLREWKKFIQLSISLCAELNIDVPISIAILGYCFDPEDTALSAQDILIERDGKNFFNPAFPPVILKTVAYSEQADVSLVFSHLQERFGPFEWPPDAPQELLVFKPAHDLGLLWGVDKDSIYTFTDETFEQFIGLCEKVVLNNKFEDRSTFIALITLLREKSQNKQLSFPSAMHTNYFHIFVNPEKVLQQYLDKMSRFGTIQFPTDSTAEDSTDIRRSDIPIVKETIRETYQFYAELCNILLQYQEWGIPFATDKKQMYNNLLQDTAITDEAQQLDPTFRYALVIYKALYGDEAAIDTLEDIESGQIKVEAKIDPFVNAVYGLRSVSYKIISLKDPSYRQWDRFQFDLSNQTTLGMIELAPPVKTDSLAERWLNPQEHEGYESSQVEHATWVSETLLDGGTGSLWNAVLSQQNGENIYVAFDRVLGDALAAIKDGTKISVINISLSFETTRGSIENQMALRETVQWQELQKKVAELKKHRIPVVIAAGNAGFPNSEATLTALTGNMINVLADVDSSFIIVGATDAGYRSASFFSGVGSDTVRPDVITIGEGIYLQGRDQAAESVSGTSFAAPIVTRLVAKMREINPRLSVEQIQAILKMTALDSSLETPSTEGAGTLEPRYCLYLAETLRGVHFGKERQQLALKYHLNESERKSLDWLASRMRLQVLFKDTTVQTYGE